ncbi:GntR family transcriptional regulator [Geminicoccaceae bacterium 1502E]|nr:GntR family transcriptional regulator [Geminicoccaceae bacterium 1502E]
MRAGQAEPEPGDGREDTLSSQAYALIEEMIVDGAAPPGHLLSEQALSQSLGIGRTPVREALQRLAANGLVRIVPRRGYYVSELDVREFFSMLDLRRELERYVATRVAARITPPQAAALRDLGRRLREAAARGDGRGVLRLDREFKSLLVELVANRFVGHAIEPLHALSRQFYFVHVEQTDQEIGNAHADLLDAIADGDVERAAAASDIVMDSLHRFARDVIERIMQSSYTAR